MQNKIIETAFKEYVKAAQEVLCNQIPAIQIAKKLRLAYIAPNVLLPSLVKTIESSKEFRTLAEAVKNRFPSRRIFKEMELVLSPESALGHFFRRSGFYQKLFESKKVRSEDYFELLWSALAGDTRPVRKNFSLISARFERNLIDFSDFSIRKFTQKQLEKLTRNRINRVFYPEALINTELLSEYWFLTWDSAGNGRLVWDRPHTPIPRTFQERPIQWISVYDWLGQPRQHFGFGSLGLRIPFSFTVNNDLLDSPSLPDPLCQVKEFPPRIAERDEFYGRKIKGPQIKVLKETIEKVKKISELAESAPRWDFVNLAMGYLAKAFTTEDKLEQILWHVCVLEALFGAGDRKELTNTIRKRLSTFLGKTQAERDDLIKTFNRIYDVRCDLVHSDSFDRQPTFETVVASRDIARRSLVWFADLVLSKQVSPRDYPRRSDLLSWMDREVEQ